MLTDEELRGIGDGHTFCGDSLGCCMCYLETKTWPCPTRRLLDEIERLRTALVQIVELGKRGDMIERGPQAEIAYVAMRTK